MAEPPRKPVVKATTTPAKPTVKAAGKPVTPVVKASKPASKAAAKPAKPATPRAPRKAAPEPVTEAPLTVAPVADTIGIAEERHPDEPVVPLPPRAPTMLDELFEPAGDGGTHPMPVRIAAGDWRPALVTALPAVLVAVVLAALGALALVYARQPGGDELVGDTSPGRLVRYACAALGMAFGSPLSATSSGDDDFSFDYAVRFPALTVTLAALVALWLLARRAAWRNLAADRLADSVRAAAVFAAGIAAVSAFGRWSVPFEEQTFDGDVPVRLSFAVSPFKAFFWAFLAAYAVVWLASGPLALPERAAGWLLAARGALVGLGAGVAVAWVVLAVLGYLYVDEAGGDASDITRALPLALAYGVGFGLAMLGVLAGGEFGYPIGDRHQWSYFADGVPGVYLLLLVVPAVAVLAGALYVTRRGGVPRAEAVRACARMAFPAALLWLGVAVAGSARLTQSTGFGFIGGSTAGPRLWDALLVGLWFGAGGWVAGRVLAQRAFDQPEDAPVP